MSVLNRDDFFARVQNIVGTDTSDESLQFVEDMTDTYNEMERQVNGDGINWQERYNELDNSWRERYRHRFFNGGSSYIPQERENETKDGKGDTITIDDLFN